MALSSQENSEKHQYSEPWEDSDVVLTVEDEKFHVHSNILSIASPVFKAMLSSHLKEGREKVVNLPGKEKFSILMLLNLIYPINYKLTDYSCCRSLLELAREYEIKRILEHIDDFIYHEVECSFDALQLAEEFHLKRAKKKHIEYYVKMNVISYLDDKWNTVSDKTKLQILLGKIEAMKVYSGRCSSCFSCNYCEHRTDSTTWENALDLKDATNLFKKM